MCRTRKCAEGRSWFRRCRAASRVGCSEREAIVAVRCGWRGEEGAWERVVCGRRVWRREERSEGVGADGGGCGEGIVAVDV